MNEKLELTFSYLSESDLEEVSRLYDAERPVVTNRNKMRQTFSKIKNNPFATIWSVRVRREYRRLKIGSRLFEYIENMTKEMNCEFICLSADKDNVPANEFYKKLGYECDNGYVKILKNES